MIASTLQRMHPDLAMALGGGPPGMLAAYTLRRQFSRETLDRLRIEFAFPTIERACVVWGYRMTYRMACAVDRLPGS